MFGLYEYLGMPLGLTNSLASFNCMMKQLFRPHRCYNDVFFDDIVIYSKILEEHKQHFRVIFEVIRDIKLYINQKKSEFFLKEIQYLDHIISNSGICMDPEKLEVIKRWPIPTNLHELQSFIGMCAYYRRFIEKFSYIARPLHDLTKKNVKFVSSKEENNAFEKLKGKLISKPVLILLDLSKLLKSNVMHVGIALGRYYFKEGMP